MQVGACFILVLSYLAMMLFVAYILFNILYCYGIILNSVKIYTQSSAVNIVVILLFHASMQFGLVLNLL